MFKYKNKKRRQIYDKISKIELKLLNIANIPLYSWYFLPTQRELADIRRWLYF